MCYTWENAKSNLNFPASTRNTTRLTGDTVDRIFANGGVDNTGFDAGPSNTDEDSVHGAGVGRPG